MFKKTGPVPGQITAALREANRTQFAAATPSFGAARDHVLELERLLARTTAERDQRQAHIDALHASTSWRLTRPVRWVAGMLRPKREEPVVEIERAEPPPRPIPTYDDWIAGEEAEVVDRLLNSPRGGGAAASPRIGLVCIGLERPPPLAEYSGAVAALMLESGMAPADIVAASVAKLDADLICFLDPDITLADNALALVVAAAAREPELDVIFGDEDWLDGEGRRTRPFFKPGWNAAMQQAGDLLGPCTFFRTSMIEGATIQPGPAWRYDLANQMMAATRPERIGHIPAVLCHRRGSPRDYDGAVRDVVSAKLQREGLRARVEQGPNAPWPRIIYTLPEPPLVSVIIPTRDHPELLQVCTDGLLHETDYARLELLIVDNGTADREALALLGRLAADERVRVLRDASPFNWAALNNRAAAVASGELLLLLNNDIAVLRPDWLTELVAQTLQPGVGAAGAKLLYPDGRVQHAGITTDRRGAPRHICRFAPGDGSGPFGLLASTRDVWGVTGACMSVRKDAFFAVGGLNEAFPITFNDVDFCLRLTASGYRIVWTPWAVLKHRELATRPADHSEQRQVAADEELRRFQRDWGAFVQRDPTLHPSLELIDEQPCFRLSPRQGPASGEGLRS